MFRNKKRQFISIFTLIILLSTTFFNLCSSISYAESESSTLHKGEVYHGFKLVEERELDNIKSLGRVFHHEKSGIKLVQIKNEDKNKYFSLNFRTPPNNDNGVLHILEHSIIAGGSEKYPVKQIFYEIPNITRNFNASTYFDRTTYYFSSMNDKEFSNLMSVYLDLLFNPLFYNNENVFKNQGWHYKIENKDKPLEYNGIVYNEMKGRQYSSQDQHIYSVLKSLYPDTCYKYNSGGVPEEIPNLTFEELKEYYDEYYHPSNCYIFVYGDIDILDKLKFMNDSYFKNYNKINVDSKIKIQRPFSQQKEFTIEYPISKEDDEKGKTRVALNFSMGESDDYELDLALKNIVEMLFKNYSSPVLQKLNQAGFYSVDTLYFEYGAQPFLSIVANNIDENMKDKFVDIIYDSLEEIVEKGIEENLLKASLNSMELSLRLGGNFDQRAGSIYEETVLNYWIYDKDPFMGLETNKVFTNIKSGANKSYFENLIKKYILENKHSSIVTFKPKKGLAEEMNKEIEDKLQEYKETLSDKEIDKLIEEYNDLQKWVDTPNSEKALKTLPTLSLKDVQPEIEEYPTIEKDEKGIKVLFHPLYTNRVNYVRLFFDTSVVKQEQIPYIQLLSVILGRTDTENYSSVERNNEKRLYLDGIFYGHNVFSDVNDNAKYYPKIEAYSWAITENIPKLLEFMDEEINNIKFDHKEKLRQIISFEKTVMEMELNDDPHGIAIGRNMSYRSSMHAYNEKIKGLDYYNFILDLHENFDERYEDIIKNLQEVSDAIFNKDNLLVSFIGEESEYKVFRDNLSILTDNLGDKKLEKQIYKFKLESKNEGFIVPTDVVYNTIGFDISEDEGTYNDGKLFLLFKVLEREYFKKEIRVKGGAYSAQINNSEHNVVFSSYRDPNLRETYDVFYGIVDYIENFHMNEKDFEKQILKALAQYYVPKTNIDKGILGTSHYISGNTVERRKKELNEMLNTKPEDMRKLAPLIEKGLKKSSIITVGNEKLIKENKELFNSINSINSIIK